MMPELSAEIMKLIDAVAWAKTCMLVAAATKPGSPERATEIARLEEAIVEPRRIVDEIFSTGGMVSDGLRVELRVCEKAVDMLKKGAMSRGKVRP